MGNSCSDTWLSLLMSFDGVLLCCLFFPRDVLGKIWDLIESVSEASPSYSFRVIEGLVFPYSGFSKGHNSIKNVGKVMVLVLCTSSEMLYILCITLYM